MRISKVMLSWGRETVRKCRQQKEIGGGVQQKLEPPPPGAPPPPARPGPGLCPQGPQTRRGGKLGGLGHENGAPTCAGRCVDLDFSPHDALSRDLERSRRSPVRLVRLLHRPVSGKGDTPRPFAVTQERFAENWARAFGQTAPKTHAERVRAAYEAVVRDHDTTLRRLAD